MTAVVTDPFRVHNALNFVNSTQENIFYMFFGNTVDRVLPDDLIMAPENAIGNYFYSAWRNMLGGKRIYPENVSFVIPKNLWITQTEYDVYDVDDPGLKDKKSIVVTDDFNVYACIEKPLSGASTVKPVSVSPNVTEFSSVDRYRWKFLYKIDALSASRFVTTNYIPVKNVTGNSLQDQLQLNVQQTSVEGSILAIKVISAGSGYTSATLSITGDGFDLAATVVLQSGQIRNVVVTNPGYNYTNCQIEVIGNGSGAAVRAVMPPIGGFGADMIATTLATSVIVNPSFEGNENSDLIVGADFSQIGLVKNPLNRDGSPYTQETFRQTYKFTIGSINGSIVQDQIIRQTSSGAVGHIVSYNEDTDEILVAGVGRSEFTLGGILSESPFLNASILNIEPVDLKLYSSDVFFVDNRASIIRSEDQFEKIQLVLEF